MATQAEERGEAAGERADDCPRCGAAVAPFQEYCLECGFRLPAEGGPRAALTAWREGSPWNGADWLWPVLASLVVAVVVAAVVVAAARTNDRYAEAYLTATSPQASPPPTEQALPPTAPQGTAAAAEPPPPPTEARQPPPRETRPRELIEWPAGRNGFTVVLASLPKQGGREDALARAKSASVAGLGNVGVLDSDRYSSFHPGYYVVFSGIYSSFDAAERASARAHEGGYADAYPKQVAR